MNSVWNGLYERDEYLPVEYLEYVIAQRHRWKSLSKVPPKSRETMVKKVAARAETLGEDIRRHRREIVLSLGFPLTLPELLTIAAVDNVRERGRRLPRISRPEGVPLVARRFRNSNLHIPVEDILRALAQRLRHAIAYEISIAPGGKPNDFNAERTFVIKRLGEFMREQCKQTHAEWIASTANTLFPKPRGQLVDKVHVQNLLPSAPWPSPTAARKAARNAPRNAPRKAPRKTLRK
jgi:hypothetical protein